LGFLFDPDLDIIPVLWYYKGMNSTQTENAMKTPEINIGSVCMINKVSSKSGLGIKVGQIVLVTEKGYINPSDHSTAPFWWVRDDATLAYRVGAKDLTVLQ